jgi:hypothetical protein
MAKKAVKFTQDAIEKLPKNLPVVYIINSETEKHCEIRPHCAPLRTARRRHRKIPRARAPGTAPMRSAWRKESPCAGAPTQGSRRRKIPDARCALRPSSRRGCGSTGSIVPLIFRAIARNPGPSAEWLHGDASGPRGRRIAAPRCRRNRMKDVGPRVRQCERSHPATRGSYVQVDTHPDRRFGSVR